MNQKIINYCLVQAYEKDLVAEIMLRISNGWSPLGGAQPMQIQGWYAQTMVKYEPT